MSELPEIGGPRGPVRRFVEAFVDIAIQRPLFVLLFSILSIIAANRYISAKLELRSDFLELLPRDSPGFIAFEQQLHRVGGGATLYVVVESPDRAANERFVDAVSKEVRAIGETRAACVKDSCEGGPSSSCAVTKCGPELVSYIEDGTKEVRAFFQENKWLYADLEDLESADQTLDNQIAIQSGLVENLEGSDDDLEGSKARGSPSTEKTERKNALGMDEYKKRWDDRANKHDDFPTGYFATTDGRMMGVRIVSPTTGTGDRGGDILLARVTESVKKLDPAARHAEMRVGFAGDIPNAIAEKDSIVSEAAWATGIATVLILFGVFAFFRSFSAMFVMLLPAGLGVACAYSFATATFGYVNTSGAFLGAIILGNGINYPIVLLGRYREFVARGLPPDVAKKAAVWNAFRAELVGASVAGIAYGSLVITRFRGFSQFGMIGFVGMLLVWLSIIPLVPATVTVFEKLRARPTLARLVRARDRALDWGPMRLLFPAVEADGSRGPLVKLVARITARYPRVILAVAAILTVAALVKIPGFLRDPWEYNFAHLGSSKSKKRGGAGEWSVKAEKVFGGKMNVAGAMMLADKPEQTLAVKKQILENDEKDPKGRLVADVATVHDLLPGTQEEQRAKLAVLERIRERLTPRVLHDMKDDERTTLEDMKPPEDLRVLEPRDLPALLRRRFQEKDGTVGTVFFVKYRNDVSLSNGHNLLRIAHTTDNVHLPDGTVVKTASRSTIFAEMIRSMERDGPLASGASLLAVSIVVLLATASFRGFVCVMVSLIISVIWMVGGAAASDMKLNFLNFIALPITFGIGCEYPFNIFDRSRLLGGDVTMAVRRSGGAVALCSFTTTVGYGSLLFADNQALQSFGRLAMSGEILALFAALFVLPAMLQVWKSSHPAALPSRPGRTRA
ncbi:MAG: exporters of the superfamily [Labilithrix sp.]|nr:exporters of the superfamily [Labilithrix sp.]